MTKKRIGPSLVHCGTPALTFNQLDTTLPNVTHWRRPVRKLQIHGIIDLLTPISINLCTTMLWLILSKALQNQRNMFEYIFLDCSKQLASCGPCPVNNKLLKNLLDLQIDLCRYPGLYLLTSTEPQSPLIPLPKQLLEILV